MKIITSHDRTFWIPLAGIVGITLLLGAILLRFAFTGPTWFPVNNLRIFYYLILTYDLPAFYLFLGILCAAPFLRKILPVERLVVFLTNRSVMVTLLLFMFLCGGAVFVYQNFPLCMDEYAATFQATVFAEGKLWGEIPPELAWGLIPNGEDNPFFRGSNQTGYFISKYWWGYSLLLAPFVYLGIPWLLNPLFGAASLFLLGSMGKKLFPDNRHACGWILLITLASPQFVVTSISYYSMPAHLFFNLGYAALLMDPKPGRILAAGAIGGLALCLHHPFPHAVFAVPWIAWLLWRPGRITNLALLSLGYLPVFTIIGGGYLLTKAYVTGPLTESDAGLVQNVLPGAERVFALGAQILNAIKEPTLGVLWVRLLNFIKLWFWSAPGVMVFACIGAVHCRRNPPLALLACSGAATLLAMFFFHGSQGHGWGHRYFHSCWGILPLLATGFFSASCCNGQSLSEHSHRLLLQVFGACCILSLVCCNGQRLLQVDDHITRHRSVIPSVNEQEPHVVFVPRGFYSLDLVQNDPFFRAPTVFIPSAGTERNRKLMRNFFPDAVVVDSRGLAWRLTKPPGEYVNDFRRKNQSP